MPISNIMSPEILLRAITNPEQAAVLLASQGVGLTEQDAMALSDIGQGAGGFGNAQGLGSSTSSSLSQAGISNVVPQPRNQLGLIPQGQVTPTPPQSTGQSQPDLGQILASIQPSSVRPPSPPPPVAPRGGTYQAPNNLIPLLQLASQNLPQGASLGSLLSGIGR